MKTYTWKQAVLDTAFLLAGIAIIYLGGRFI